MESQTIMELPDLLGEMAFADDLAVQSIVDGEALTQLTAYAEQLRDWTPNEGQTLDELMQGLASMIIGASALHHHADLQRVLEAPAAMSTHMLAQSCLQKAVTILDIAIRSQARSVMGPLSPTEYGAEGSYH